MLCEFSSGPILPFETVPNPARWDDSLYKGIEKFWILRQKVDFLLDKLDFFFYISPAFLRLNFKETEIVVKQKTTRRGIK